LSFLILSLSYYYSSLQIIMPATIQSTSVQVVPEKESQRKGKVVESVDMVNEVEMVKLMREKIELSADIVTKLKKFTDSFLLKFLRAKKYNVKAALAQLKSYLEMKEKNKDMFMLPENVKMVFDDNGLGMNDLKSPTGESILIGRPGNWNPSTYKFDLIISATVTTLEAAILDESIQKSGIVVIIDMKGFGMKHLAHFSVIRAKRIAELADKALPVQLNQIHVVNQSKVTDIAYAVIKPFLSTEFTRKIRFHGTDFTELHKVVPKEVLPSPFGGTGGDFSSENFYNQLLILRGELEEYWKSSE